MVSLEPSKRPTVEQILAPPWMQGVTVDEASWRENFARRKEVVDTEAKVNREQKAIERQKARNQAEPVVHRGSPTHTQATQVDLRSSCEALPIHDFGPLFQLSNTQFFSSCQPLDYFCAFAKYLSDAGTEYRISSSKLKLKYCVADLVANTDVEVHLEVLRVS